MHRQSSRCLTPRFTIARKTKICGFCFALALIATYAGAPPASALSSGGAPLVLEATIPLEAVSGRIDHMAVDRDKRRLVVAELGNNTVDIIDLETRRPLVGSKVSTSLKGSLTSPASSQWPMAAMVPSRFFVRAT